MNLTEKAVVECVSLENGPPTRTIQSYDAKDVARVVRKLDLHLLPLCFILYTFSVLDRSNLGNARLAGLDDDMNLDGDRYQLLGTMFYIAYIVFQFSSMGWKIFKAHHWVVSSSRHTDIAPADVST